MADKKLRIQNLIAKNLSEIIHDMKDDITNLASINQVEVNQDFSMAKVYVTHLQPENIDPLINFLTHNKGQIRSKLAKTLDIYKIPDIQFIKDDLFDQGQKIDNIINSWHKN